ncbi:MAG: 4-(cytidine 5'-diphospho)-2-C-methyl-D-erythritol kinase [Lentimicrobium sp.]|jgi:4-diphosphocytidyl-2-C-methyl-D-erythritol kinase|nr:4-(cytidine 5'-diphospho)-2-C-methyl-D-erythritol kinase [Lentimicrobium sp.]
MICFPNAKINLGLRVLRKREDGFHDIETLMIPLCLCDALEIVPAEKFGFNLTGLAIEDGPDNNLCLKAFKIMQQRYDLPPVHIHLHKVIPTGAGLGGGSSDAAFTLKLLRRVFKLKFCGSELNEMAQMLGSDCNFFIHNQAALCTGRGEVVSPVDFNLKGWHLMLVKPPFNVATSDAYAQTTLSGKALWTEGSLPDPPDQWKDWMVNDFEAGLMERYPVLAEIRDKLYSLGAAHVSLSGSGSAMYGLFKTKPESKDAFGKMFTWEEEFS